MNDLYNGETIRRDIVDKNSLRCYYLDAGDVSSFRMDDQHYLLFALRGKVRVSVGLGYTEHVISSGEFVLVPRRTEFASHALERSDMVIVSFDGNYNNHNRKYLESLYSTAKKAKYMFAALPIRPVLHNFLNHISISMGGTLKYQAVPEVIMTLLRQEYSDTEMGKLFYPVLWEKFAGERCVL